MILSVNTKDRVYDIVVERNALEQLEIYLNLKRKVLVISDSLVPSEYTQLVVKKCEKAYLFIIESGEENKNFDNYRAILNFLIEKSFNRTDAIIAVGGGVVGDLAGFVASTYMRGIDFYNIPTTLLAQVDSSIGGKTAINIGKIKNIVGAFYQPKKVIIDPNTLKTLNHRLLVSGLVEALKMAVTCNKDLFNLIKTSNCLENDLETIIIEALKIKKKIVENDPKELGIRKVLNFGHTIGHIIESCYFDQLYHGECVGIGMLYMCSNTVKSEIKMVLEKYHLPTKALIDEAKINQYLIHDKKMIGDDIAVVYVDEIGSFEIRKVSLDFVKERLNGGI